MCEEAEEKHERVWVMGQYTQAHVLADIAVTLKRDPQYHPDETPPKHAPAEIAEDRRRLELAKAGIAAALDDITRFTAHYGLPPLFGEAPPREVKTAEQIRHNERQAEVADFKRRFLED